MRMQVKRQSVERLAITVPKRDIQTTLEWIAKYDYHPVYSGPTGGQGYHFIVERVLDETEYPSLRDLEGK